EVHFICISGRSSLSSFLLPPTLNKKQDENILYRHDFGKEGEREDRIKHFGMPNGVPYDPLFYLCCSGVVTPKTGSKPKCCGTRSHDYASELCCQGNIYPKDGLRPGCCGSIAFDAEFFLCCAADHISPKRGTNPRCCGTQGYDPAIERCCPGYVVVKGRPKISRTPGYFTTTPQLIAEGTTKYVFHCYASGWPKPSFTWLKNGTEIKDGDVDKSYVLIKRPGGLELNILSVTKEDHQGHYSCVARNIFGKRRYGILLKVKKQVPLRPLAHAHVNKVSKYTGEPALLTCVGLFTTEVTTVISWDFNGSQLNLDTDEHYKLDYVYYEEDLTPKVNFSLLIKKVTERDTGKYRCRVITPGWTASDMIFLSLVKPPHLETDDFQYDVFVSFSTLDYPWVRDSLTPMLERKQINYCIHSRDFVVGKAIIENMADSVYNSRKVLAVISQNYLASHFCREELEIALYRCTKMADSSLLLIRVDDVDKKNLPKTLRRRTFLDYSSAMERSEWEQRLLKHIQVDESDAKIDTRKSSDKCQLI
ncbi:unnamed protein product, partial [Porites lobata]